MARNNTNQAIEKSSANNVNVWNQLQECVQQRSGRTFAPSIDVHDTGNEWVLTADIPGADPQNINITCEERVLTLQAPVQPCWPRRASMRRHEYDVGDYHRAFRLGEDIDPQGVHAEFQHGVLTLHLPRAERARATKIPIRSS